MLSFLVLLALAFGFLNGFHDAANSIATVVSTRVLRPHQAVAWAAGFNLLALALLQTGVATTIGTGLVDPTVVDPAAVFGALIAAIVWNLITLRLGIPTSSSHALIAGLAGATMASAGPQALLLPGLGLFLLFLLLAPLIGLLLGAGLMVAVLRAFSHVDARKADRRLRQLQLLSSAVYSIGHGSNDGQKTLGIVWLLLLGAGQAAADAPPTWAVLASYLAIAAGTLFGGWRIVRTMGQRLIKLTPAGGFCAEAVGAATIHFATWFGAPISTTQALTASIVGVGAVNRVNSVRWGVARVILWAWAITLPAAALIGALACLAAKALA
ncbi:MAG: inorganic phosphate transporter [Burkholderiaceae bacterium]|nr:inorganic phosphate transporter [Burkholderiaceae bacterium]